MGSSCSKDGKYKRKSTLFPPLPPPPVPLDFSNLECRVRLGELKGDLCVRQLLFENNLNAREVTGRTPLTLACEGGHDKVVEYLLRAGADVKGHLQAALNHARVVELLLQHGADVNEEFDDERWAITTASERGNLDVVKVLLQHGADVNVQDCYGRTALHYATVTGNIRLTRLLLKYQPDLEICDYFARTPLYTASYYPPVFRALLERGANVHVLDYDGWSLLHTQLESDVLAALLDYGCGRFQCWCKCHCTMLFCRYVQLSSVGFDISDYERFFTRFHLAQLPIDEWVDQQLEVLKWPESDDYRTQCLIELAKISHKFIPTTTLPFQTLLHQNFHEMKSQPFLLTPKICRRKFPIYGNVLFASYLKIRRPLLLELCSSLFALMDPSPLPYDCAVIVLKYLTDEDLVNVAKICLSRQFALLKISRGKSLRPKHEIPQVWLDNEGDQLTFIKT